MARDSGDARPNHLSQLTTCTHRSTHTWRATRTAGPPCRSRQGHCCHKGCAGAWIVARPSLKPALPGLSALHKGPANLATMHAFNANFYLTAATVIPVLYLALTLQGNTYNNLMTRWRKINKESSFTFWPQVRVVTAAILAISGAAITILGIIGEYSALQALVQERTGPNTQVNVFDACTALLITVGIGPVYLFLNAFFGTMRDDFLGAVDGRLGARFPSLRKYVTGAASDGDEPHEEQPEPGIG